ncbi:MAG: hypothetical protein JNL90_04800 [Planctomycetes bacterium]|nr:hypothetical protein [Planctomycetota bacterium]
MAVSSTEVQTKQMHPGFFFFPEIVPKGTSTATLHPIQVEEELLLTALKTFDYKVTSNGLQRLLNIAGKGESLDFHVTFTLEAGTDKVKPDLHFAIRKDSVGHNEVLYWWYQLNRVGTTNQLCFVWTGCAGGGNAASMSRNHTPGVQYGTTAIDILTRLLDALSANMTAIGVNKKSKVLTLS